MRLAVNTASEPSLRIFVKLRFRFLVRRRPAPLTGPAFSQAAWHLKNIPPRFVGPASANEVNKYQTVHEPYLLNKYRV